MLFCQGGSGKPIGKSTRTNVDNNVSCSAEENLTEAPLKRLSGVP